MAGISDNYQSQVKHYRDTHFGDDPGVIRNIIFGLRSVFSSVKKTDPSQGSETIRKSLLKTKQHIVAPSRRKFDHHPTLLTKIRSLLPNIKPTPHLISAEEFKTAARNNDYSKYSGAVFIDGDLDLSDIPDIAELPKNLYVDGNLILSGCKKLRSLSRGKLRVTGSLVAENCLNVTNITEDIRIGEDISFRNCIQLKTIPRRIRDIGYRSNSKQRHINLEKTIIKPCKLLDTKKCMYHFSGPLGRVITEWAHLAAMDSDWPRLELSECESEHLHKWLLKLYESADFVKGSEDFKQHFARRVMKVISDALHDPEYKEVVIQTIEVASSSCSDGAALGLDDIEKLFLLKKAETMIHDPDAEQRLRNFARQIMHLELLENYVQLYLFGRNSSLENDVQFYLFGRVPSDAVEVMLHFKTRLRNKLNLPINVQNMNYRSSSGVLPKYISEAAEFVLNQSTPEALDDFLSNWAPWKKLKDKQSIPDYLALDTCTPPADQECSITGEATDEMVVLNNRVYDYENLKKWYLEAGTDPFTREKILWSEVKRFSRSEV